MKRIYNIFGCISFPARYHLGHSLWKNNTKILIGFFVLFLLPLKTTAQDTDKHDPLLDPVTGGYPIFANSVEIVSVTDSVRGPSDQVLSQQIFDMTPDGQIAESSPYVPGSGSYGLNDALWSDCVTGDFDGDGIDEILTGWVAPDGYLHLDMSSATRLKPTYNWEWNQRLLLSSSWTCTGPIKLLAVNLDSTFRKEIVVCAPSGSSLRVVPYYMDDQGENLEPGTAALFSSGSPYDIAACDLNGDGRDEIVASTPNIIYILDAEGNVIGSLATESLIKCVDLGEKLLIATQNREMQELRLVD